MVWFVLFYRIFLTVVVHFDIYARIERSVFLNLVLRFIFEWTAHNLNAHFAPLTSYFSKLIKPAEAGFINYLLYAFICVFHECVTDDGFLHNRCREECFQVHSRP